MGPIPARIRALSRTAPRRADWRGIVLFAFALALVAYLGIDGGGFDPLVHGQVGIAVWWIALAGVVVGALPRRRPEALAWTALGLLTAFSVWTALSLGWTDSADRTFADLAQVLVYLGVFVLAVLLRSARGARRVVAGVGAAIAIVAAVALLSRMRPGAFPDAGQTALFLGGAQERLSFPLNYWNGLAALIAMGLPLVLQVASSARSAITRGFAAGALPGLMLAAFLTLSRGGIAAAVLGLLVFLAFAANRLPKLATLALAGAGGATLILIAAGHHAFRHGLGGAAARSEGDEMLLATVLICFAVGLAQTAVSAALRGRRRPRWTVVSPRQAWIATGVGVLALVVVALALGAPSRGADAWEEFKGKSAPGEGAARLASAAGENRYQYWSAALDENATRPLPGTGSGTFEIWWNRHGNGSIVRDAHSLYMQTLGELGIVGAVLLVGFLIVVLGGGAWRVVAAEQRARSQLAAALGGCAAFCLTAAFDWTWQLPVLPVAFMLLASALLTAGARSRHDGTGAFPLAVRAGFAALALGAIAAIAIPLASTSLLRESQAEAREGDLSAALGSARTATSVRSGSAAARLQEALVLERLGRLGAAAKAAGAAAEREPKDWRPWFVLSRIYAEQGRVGAALDAYRRARLRNPHSILFGLPS